jgi:hypothetical protein
VSVTGGDHDFDLHGIVGVRVLDATQGDVAKVARQLGPISAPLTTEPDISIRFVDRLRTHALTYVEVGETGFDGVNFYVLRGRGGTVAKALIPFDDVGRSLEIICERTMPVVPHLLACINMVAVSKGVLPLHASAFEHDGRGVLVMGWAKGGKTEALLAHMEHGDCYIGDEWIYLTPDGRMLGLPEPIRLWAWHLAQEPRVLAARRRTERLRLAGWQALAMGLVAAGHGGPVRAAARRVHPMVQRQAFLRIPPEELFSEGRMTLEGRLDAAVLMMSHESDRICVERADPEEISARMAASLAHERDQFLTHYLQFRFAFPTRRSSVVECAPERERALLRALFDGRDARKVLHPYPCNLAELGDAVEAAVDGITHHRTPHGVR